jgi:hypothetical protein
MATGISFHVVTGNDMTLDLAGRGLGFFGTQGSGSTIPVDDWNSTTYVVQGDPWNPVAQVNNITYQSANSGLIQSEVSLHLTGIPNYQATLNVRFENDTAVNVINARCNLYDGEDLDTPPVGWNARLAEIVHPGRLQDLTGEGDGSWHVASTGEMISLVGNPGLSGASYGRFLYDGASRHDWYLAMSVSPDQIGSKTAGLNVYLEYL